MACCGLGPTFGALERFPVNSFDTVLITGAGPVGLGGIINAKYRGAKVISVDAIQYRRKLASDLGADLVLDAMDKDINEKIFEFTQGKGVNVVLETSGTKGGFNTGLNTIKRLGKMAIIGEAKEIVINNVFVNLIQKGITIVGQWHFNMSGIHKMMEMIKNCPSVEKMITHRFPMSQMNEALAVCSSKNCGKVVLDPWK
ncbi:MAG TPA: zinc-binding dehydrogenase [Clostridia bacterium]|nr:zinc-binding dehydrogenase [Clostridia bacterium]